jgi:hypothetical protein
MNRPIVLNSPILHLALFLVLSCIIILPGCESQPSQPPTIQTLQQIPFNPSGEDLLILMLEEMDAIADWAESNGGLPGSVVLPGGKVMLSKPTIDTIFIYGEEIGGGLGTVVTERHTYPKGLPLITVRRTYGGPDGETVSELSRYISHQDFFNNSPEQYIKTTLSGLADGRIVTHVERDGIVETFTFRTPVITRNVGSDGSVQVSTRYGTGSAVVTEVRDGAGGLIRLTQSYGTDDGSVYRRTDNPDGSWRITRVLGQADGSILREITTGP